MASQPKKRGIYADPATVAPGSLQDKVADFSYSSDALAHLVVELWTDTALANSLTGGTNYTARKNAAKSELEDRGIYLRQPIVITEDEYEAGFSLAAAGLSRTDGIVLVLPRDTRTGATTSAPKPLLETAKMLMAVTPNGI